MSELVRSWTTAITVRYTDGSERTVTVNRSADGQMYVPVEDGVAHFGRDDGDGWRAFFAAPLVNIKDWG